MADKKLTIERSMADFKKAYRAKRKLIEREKDDFLFALGKQWDSEKYKALKDRKINPVTDNRVAPNIFLITGLERQNRTDFKAFPIGEEDSIKAEIASALFKDAIKSSEYGYKSSEQFKDGVTCGESHLELYLDNTYNLLNGKPCWKKVDGDKLFPEPGFREYDFNDARYVYKLTLDLSKEDLIALYPEKRSLIEAATNGKLNFESMLGASGSHNQPKDYPRTGGDAGGFEKEEQGFDLLERYYKKWIDKHYIGDKSTGQIQEAESKEKAKEFIDGYNAMIAQEQQDAQIAQAQVMAAQAAGAQVEAPILPPPSIPDRFIHFTRLVPEIWCFAHVPGIDEPLGDEVAWFYPKWKSYPFIPYFARFSTAPITGDDSHLLVQGLVHGVKGAQEKHNSAETLMLLHLNGSANSGWLTEEESWVDPKKVEALGATPSVNLEYKAGKPMPQRIFPMALSQGHMALSEQSAEAIKAQLGINSDLLAVQEGSSQSGRAIALRQRQGLIMVQELFDNLSRSRQIAGRFLLSQMGSMYDTDTAMKVLGDAFMVKNFPTQTVQKMDTMTGQMVQVPVSDEPFDEQAAIAAISEVLSGELEKYDVAVGEAVASETMKLANSAELKEFAQANPGIVPPELVLEESQLPQTTKNKVISAIKNARAAAMNQPPVAA